MNRPISTPKVLTTFLIMLLLLSGFLANFLLQQKTAFLVELPLFTPSPSLPSLTLILDPISSIFLFVVTLISRCVFNFSKGYIQHEPYLNRFSGLVLLFIVSIYLLIFIPNILTLLLGWDGLGLTSFLLIIYYQNPKSLGAGMFTFISNRLGDALIIISVALTLHVSHWNLLLLWQTPITYYISLILMIGAITKRAQIPFSRWLPAAIAAPTPVSALVHSSTLVTAGVYLLIRFYPMLSSNLFTINLLLILSVITTLMAGLAALFETDIKKIIALSTLSQLGIIISSISLGSPVLSFFHLITHATFKALLFISAGTLIHSFINTQDLRLLGNVANYMPLTSAAINTANIALCGLPFLSGFYSKDQIIELTIRESSNIIGTALTLFSTTLTAAYSARLSYYLLWSPRSSSPLITLSDNSNNAYTRPIVVIASAAVITGALMNWCFLFPISLNPINYVLKLAALIFTSLGLFCIHPKILTSSLTPSTKFLNFPNTLITIWFLTHLTTQIVARPSTFINSKIIKTLDHGWTELSGPQGNLALLTAQSVKIRFSRILNVSSILITFSIIITIFFFTV